MLLFTPVLIGIVVGIAMAIIFKRHRYIPHNIIYGVVGALIFRILTYFAMSPYYESHPNFSFIGIFSSFVGALSFTYVTKLFSPIKPINTEPKEEDGKSQ